MTDAQKKIIYIVLVTVSPSLADAVASAFHLVPAEIAPFVRLLDALTAAIGMGWGIVAFTPGNLARSASTIQGVQLHADRDTAPASVVALANDRTGKTPDIVPMAGGANGKAVPVQK